MDWLATAVLALGNPGARAPVLLVALVIVAAVALVPAFLLTVAAARDRRVVGERSLAFVGAAFGTSAAYGVRPRHVRLKRASVASILVNRRRWRSSPENVAARNVAAIS